MRLLAITASALLTAALAACGTQTPAANADPDYLAIRIYRSVGFEATETQLQVQRKPAGSTSSTSSIP